MREEGPTGIREGVSELVSDGRRKNNEGEVRQEIREGVGQSVSEGRRTNSEGGTSYLLALGEGGVTISQSVGKANKQ